MLKTYVLSYWGKKTAMRQMKEKEIGTVCPAVLEVIRKNEQQPDQMKKETQKKVVLRGKYRISAFYTGNTIEPVYPNKRKSCLPCRK